MRETAEDRARQVMASSRFFRIHMFDFQKQESNDAHRDECKRLWIKGKGFFRVVRYFCMIDVGGQVESASW